MYTRDVDAINVKKNDAIAAELVKIVHREKIEQCRALLRKKTDFCACAWERIFNENRWIRIENKPFLFYQTDQCYYLIPSWKEEQYKTRIKNYDWLWTQMLAGNMQRFIDGLENIDGVPMMWMRGEDKKALKPLLFWISGSLPRYLHYIQGSKIYNFFPGDSNSWEGYEPNGSLFPIHKTDRSEMPVLSFLIQYNLLPAGLSDEERNNFQALFELKKKKQIKIGQAIDLADNFDDVIGEGAFLGEDMSRKQVLQDFAEGRLATGERSKFIVDFYLNCDKERADIEPYDEGQLFEVNRGHWEVWSDAGSDKGKIHVKLQTPLVARNPLADVNRSGVVGIDFGTKSTVVVLLDDNSQIHQMRIGSGQLMKEVKKSDYENPTVMEFRDVQNFMKHYLERDGRPRTQWKDLTVSHTAADSLRNAQDSQDYYTFFSDLKQWSDDSSRKIRIRDLAGYEGVLDDFLELGDQSLNPIEIYAYYLGLAINNMRSGIYLDYILSYPVNYPVKVRNKIVESFRRGIKKSLPDEVLCDRACMELFRVEAGASEPAAYAISALKGYGFKPQADEKIYYGIFDFGGGTTDFDFGIWRCAAGKECRRADYVIEHFGAGGDRYLGGENLLELLAFDVFKANQKVMRENNLPFFQPSERSPFPGSEMLLSNSQEARLNTRQLMEKLRPFWESGAPVDQKNQKNPRDGELAAIREGMIKVSLFNKSGDLLPNVELGVDAAWLESVLTERIRVGVVNFFEAVKNLFERPKMEKSTKMHIFLAGNSSRSPIVRRIFEELIAEKEEELGRFREKAGQDLQAGEWFEIYPALGTPEAEAKRAELGLESGEKLAEYEKPTGKTGVAYGLLEGRSASRIKIISEIASDDESKFKYYIGHEARGKFHGVMSRDAEYGKWIEFIDASESDFEIFYTSLPEATTNRMDIKRVKRVPCRIKAPCSDESVNIYLRAVEPDVLEYAVGKCEDVRNERYSEGPYRIELEE